MDMKQTAIEWIEVELKNWLEDGVCLPDYIFEEAKQMEYDQHCTTWYASIANDRKELHEPNINFKQYYNKTYGNITD